MPLIAFVGNKGGAGKTTLTVNVSSGLARESKVIVIDADPQGSSLQWRAFSTDEATVPVIAAIEELEQQAKELEQQYDYVVIDCPPSVHAVQTTTALGFCDTAIVPVQPSPVDLWATVHIEEAVNKARISNADLNAYLVINQLEPRTTLSKLVRDALGEIALPVAETALKRRAIYRSSALEGKSVFHMGSRGRDAATELEQLIQEVVTNEQ